MKRLFSFVMICLLVVFQTSAVASSAQVLSNEERICFLPPLSKCNKTNESYDQTIVELLILEIVDATSHDVVHRIENSAQKSKETIEVKNKNYVVQWKVDNVYDNQKYRVQISLKGVEEKNLSPILVGGFDFLVANKKNEVFTVNKNQTLPVRFVIKDDPEIRARQLNISSFSSSEIAQILSDEFQIGEDEIVSYLKNEGFVATEIANALHGVYDTTSMQTAEILKDNDFNSSEVGEAIKTEYNSSDADVAHILKAVGYFIQDVFDAIEHISGLAFDGIVEILYFVEYTFEDLFNGLNLFEVPPLKLVQTFRSMGESIDNIIKALSKTSLDFIESAYNEVLTGAGYLYDEASGAVSSFFGSIF